MKPVFILLALGSIISKAGSRSAFKALSTNKKQDEPHLLNATLMKTKTLPWPQIGALFAAMLLAVNAACLAAFPDVLVIDGTAYPGTQVSGNTGAHKYVASTGVLVLYNATGGDTAWGATENAALNTPSAVGTWDGGLSVGLAGPCAGAPALYVASSYAM